MTLQARIMNVAINANRGDILTETHYFRPETCGSQVEALAQAKALMVFCKTQTGIKRAVRKGTVVYIKYNRKGA